MSHYRSNLRDLEFNLFEVFDVRQHLGEDLDPDTARNILAEVERLAREDLAASFVDGDRHPPIFDPDTHTVTMPESFQRSYQAFMDAEFWRLDLPAELGGTPAPRMLWWSLAELVLGSNAPIWMYASGPSFAHTLWREGTPEQREWAKVIAAKRWAGTMVLTEPDAGSDVGAGRTRAIPQPDGSWHLEGVKRFITSGEHDLAENIIHYVLARPEGAGPGTKGLSLFVVPKILFDPVTGELGERNGVFATNLEHKMGLKVSATCELAFGEHGVPAKGWLLGGVHDGIRQMFMVIEYARMMVGTKAIATLSTGYLNALEYAKNRVQGPDLLRSTDKTAPRVTITHHPDVRRSLMLQKAYVEGLRALVCYTASWQDRLRAGGELAERVNDLLLPLVKGCGSERAYELLGHESLQTFGGSGFLQDYPIEQYVR
ncbi:MAG TPA: acyl-CoA dehydrogenase family protein, partial [Micromonosporaceae bacterium]|nr:acyl-CoA dehydrogenase family protein [Micromonosporaceae bacterium]